MQEILPIIQKIAKPDMKVTFLVPYPVDPWAWLRDHWIVTESPRKAVSEGKRVLARYSWDKQKRLAERRISVAREALGKMGVEVGLVLKGCFSQTLREYVLSENFQFVLMTAVTGQTMLGLMHLTTILLRRIKRPNLPSFLLYRSAALTEEDRFAALSMRAQKPLSWLEENDSGRPGEA
ncbi:MAG TPA: hypothetical protein VGL70_18530 [Candidatus Binatia bacterium]|jgi:hypothetical protein